jgi:hypothetical protein
VTPSKKKEMIGWLEARGHEKERVQDARRRLVEAGFPEERAKSFPALQAVLLDDERQYLIRHDETIKWMGLPFWQGEPGYLADPAQRDAKDTLFGQLLITLFGESSPDIFKVRGAQARIDRRIAMLRTVEALRLYAADHDCKLPSKLSDLSVPVPDDPITGKPFAYKVEDTTAELRAIPPKVFETNSAYNLRYVIIIKK